MWNDRSLSARLSENAWLRYALALVATAIFVLICKLLHPLLAGSSVLIALYPAVVFSAWYCGVGPSIMTVAVGLLAVKYWFLSDIHSLRISDASQLAALAAFLASACVVVLLGELRRHEQEKLRQEQIELEDRVQERTADLDTANRSLRELSARLLQLQDNERRRIARELHDSVGQLLAGLAMNLSVIRADIERLTKTAATLSDSEALVQEMGKEVRTISHLLHPPLLDEAGLSSAIRWYVDGFAQRSKIKVDMDFPKDFERLPPELETAIFRVVQECLTNIHRHSASSVARIRLRHHDGEVLVEVADKGKGIPPEQLAVMTSTGTPGVGIRGMRERLRQLGATLDIDSNHSGTMVRARLPLAKTFSTTDAVEVENPSPSAAA